MLSWALAFFIIAIIAAIFGFTGIAAGAAEIAKILFVVFVVGMVAKGRRRPVVSGREEMIGALGEAIDDFETEGWMRVHGETWRARTRIPVRRGQRLRVRAINGLVLEIDPETSTGG